MRYSILNLMALVFAIVHQTAATCYTNDCVGRPGAACGCSYEWEHGRQDGTCNRDGNYDGICDL
ncbi:uncharacterized protein RCC_04372 [Ramularia collo-cygni]|uniref:Uncharacterized protein n=1 Tax=Ramularia collo-cygni TaxID=112498 RepID=A0A2D3V1I2_9PEZI|nr:uncharacterized protein RCC_04372 [Ramularia collo-cygni]CZT18527.1 uncharacterized protein RCC_04372 [Ramularia collo-cygni]